MQPYRYHAAKKIDRNRKGIGVCSIQLKVFEAEGARGAMLIALLLFLVVPALADPVFLEWDCAGSFIGCSPDPKNPVTITVDTTQQPTTYNGNGIAVEAWDPNTPVQPNAADAFSFAFDTGGGNFALVIDLIHQNDNGGSTAENIQSTKVTKVSTENSPFIEGDTQLSFDTFYGPNALPADYQKYLGSNTAEGYVLLDYNPNADENGNKNDVDSVQIVINPIPEPNYFVLLGAILSVCVAGRTWVHRRAR